MDGGLYQRVAVFWVFVKILFSIAPIISLARTSIAVAALCRDARPCVSTAPEKSYGTRRETQNVASLQRQCIAHSKCVASHPYFSLSLYNIFFPLTTTRPR